MLQAPLGEYSLTSVPKVFGSADNMRIKIPWRVDIDGWGLGKEGEALEFCILMYASFGLDRKDFGKPVVGMVFDLAFEHS